MIDVATRLARRIRRAFILFLACLNLGSLGIVESEAADTTGLVEQWGSGPIDYRGNPQPLRAVPFGIYDLVSAIAGDYQTLALRRDGTISAWESLLFQVGLRDVVQVGSSSRLNFTLHQDASLRIWTLTNTVLLRLDGIAAAALSERSAVVLTKDAEVVTWNSEAVTGSQLHKLEGLSNVVAVASGESFHAALTREGIVYTFWPGGEALNPWIEGASTLAAGSGRLAAALTNGVVVYREVYGGTTYTNDMRNGGRRVVQLAVSRSALLSLLDDGTVVGYPSPPEGLRGVSFISVSPSGRALAVRQVPADPPSIEEQPSRRLGRLGGLAEFEPLVRGVEPISYQWFKGTHALSAATAPLLRIPSLGADDAGDYWLTACNPFGCTTSQVMRLEIAGSTELPVIEVHSAAPGGVGSLREALADLNATRGGMVVLTNLNGEIPLTRAFRPIAFNTSILGAGCDLLSIRASNVANVLSVAPQVQVQLSGLRFYGCGTTNPAFGGAISNAGILRVSSCCFESNRVGGAGGAIFSIGQLSLEQCSFVRNESRETSAYYPFPGGGALCVVSGTVSVVQCQFSTNSVLGAPGSSSVSGLGNYWQLGGGGDAVGGAVLLADVEGQIDRSSFVGNYTIGGIYDGAARGGALASIRSRVRIHETRVEGNWVLGLQGGQSGEAPSGHSGGSATGGGAFAQNSELTVVQSTFSHNHLLSGNGGIGPNYGAGAGTAEGGAWYLMGGNSVFLNCTLSSNRTDAGYGHYRYLSSDVCLVGGSSSGAGLSLSNATSYLAHCTIVGNSAIGGNVPAQGGTEFGCGPGTGYGGGIAADRGLAQLANSIVSGNRGGDYFGPVTSLGGNLFGLTNGMVGLSERDLWSLDPLLGPLEYNGGSTPTHALLSGSPAIGAGLPKLSLPEDQRGNSRSDSGYPDIGAYESPADAPTSAPRIQMLTFDPVVEAGTDFSLRVLATGTPPLRYQWVKDGVDVLSATSPWMTTKQATSRQTGDYRVRITGPGGAALSDRIHVTVTMPDLLARWSRLPFPLLDHKSGSYRYLSPLAITYGMGVFAIASVSPASIWTSPDGLEWTERLRSDGPSSRFADIDYHEGRFIAAGTAGIATSTNGVDWVFATRAFTNTSASIAIGSQGVLIAAANYPTARDLWVSQDLVRWTVSPSPPDATAAGFVNGVYLVGGAYGYYMSSNLVDWTRVDLPPLGFLGYTRMFLPVDGGVVQVLVNTPPGLTQIIRSSNGIQWELAGQPHEEFDTLGYGHGTYVLSSHHYETAISRYASNRVATSVDGSTWTPRLVEPGPSGYTDMAYGRGVFVGIGSYKGDILRSLNQERPELTLRTIGSGSIQVSPERESLSYGGAATLTAVPGRWHRFERWEDHFSDNPRLENLGTVNDYTAIFVPTVPLETLTFGDASRTAPVGTPAILVNGRLVTTDSVTNLGPIQIGLRTSLPNGVLAWSIDGSLPAFPHLAPPRDFSLHRSCRLRVIAFPEGGGAGLEADPIDLVMQTGFGISVTTPGGGDIRREPIKDRYLLNEEVVVTAAPKPGWSFLGWVGELAGNDSVSRVRVDRTLEATAIFGAPLALAGTEGGTVRWYPPLEVMPFGTRVRLTALPAAGKAFSGWAGVIGGTNASATLEFTDAAPSITAQFVTLKPGQVTLSALAEGMGSVEVIPAANSYVRNARVTVHAMAEEGQEFIGWQGDVAGSNPSLELTLSRSQTITAWFSRKARLSAERVAEDSAANEIRFGLSGEAGRIYQIETTQDMVSREWVPFQSITNRLGISRWKKPVDTNAVLRAFRASP